MDTLISSALEEICSRGSAGLSLSSLWFTLTPLTSPRKKALWKNLLSIPTLQFFKNDTPFPSADPKIQLLEDAEKLDLKIVANNHLRDCFVGLYDTPSSGICPLQRRTLERLAVSRTNGITQNQLAKELGIEGNNYFYRVKNLESKKLIVRQPAVVKTKETTVDGEGGESKNSTSIVITNLIYLSRYAKHLGVQQRFEINKADVDETDGFERDSFKVDVAIKDFLPAMKAICDKLQEANDKVLIVSDIKQSLGYTGTPGHRAWRNICRRLKDGGFVEAFDAKVNGKIEHCLRLLKEFTPKHFEEKTVGHGNDCAREQPVKFGRRSQQTEQLVELPIDHQIYDLIDAKKAEGATIIEVCGRLGIDRKRNDSRLHNVFSRFGMHLQAENHKKTVAFRVRTSENSNSGETNAFLDESKSVLDGNNLFTLIEGNCDIPDRSIERDVPERSTEAFLDYNYLNADIDRATSEKLNGKEIEAELCHVSSRNGETNDELLNPEKLQEFLNQPMDTTSDAKLELLGEERGITAASSETTLLKLPDSGSYQAHPYLPLTVDGALREQRILERLQDEKFLLRVELHKWLVSLEKDKVTSMDRRTIDRLLTKLQQEGHCKCVEINLPAVTNCTSNRPIMVVLHPSVQGFPPELLGEIHDRLRSFEKESRALALSKLKSNGLIPVLDGVMRTHPRRNSEEVTVKAEAMRANGYVLAKMVRAKLLHKFLWGYLSSLHGGDDNLSTGPSEYTHKFFVLDSAIKILPIELFLKVVGTTQKLDNIIEKSKRGLLVCDLSAEEYKLLMDTRATGRLSLTVEILRRLKLIRLIRNGHSENGEKSRHEGFVHAMELRPYIEEPFSVVATSNSRSLDLRPRIRHDFILSNREAVDEYWKTLEYCYAAADPRAALLAFPGSSVPEVFQPLFWTSVRVVSAHQRAELLKRIVKCDFKNKISYKECEKIARDLNLSLQQVLRAYYGKHRRRPNIFQGAVNTNEDQQAPKRSKISFTKKKRSGESSSKKHGRVNTVNETLAEQGLMRSAETIHQFTEEEELSPSEQHTGQLLAYHEGTSVEILRLNQNNKRDSVASQYAFSETTRNRQKRFEWTDANDRQLLIQYTRHRAILGAKVIRMDWNKVPDLPAPPKTCSKRVASLKRNTQFRKALMNFCTMLSKRYAKHLQKSQSTYLNTSGCQVLLRHSTNVGSFSNVVENAEEACREEEQWDDFGDKNVKRAFEGVLLYKQISKSHAFKGIGTASEELRHLNTDMESESVSPNTLNEDIHKDVQGIKKDTFQRSRRYRLNQNFIKCLNGGTIVSAQLHKSLAVSNAVELLKLVFLSTSEPSELQNRLAETLRRYSEHDIFAAFSYLREKKILIGGDGNQPFELSQQFLQNVSRSLFPSNTGKRASKFYDWLCDRDKGLMEEGINLSADLECGDIFQLFALVSSGELSITPCVPDEGVGEADDVRSSKRKSEDVELCDSDKSKKLKSLADSELTCRREKGFPGITVLLNRASILTVDAVDLFGDVGTSLSGLAQSVKVGDILSQKIISTSSQNDGALEIPNFDCIHPAARWSGDSPWEAMAGYAEYLILKPSDLKIKNLLSPEIYRTVYMAIQKAGDQGLSLEEISRIVGEVIHEHIVDVLQAFGCVLKVNAYDSVHVVDALYHSKYFLTSWGSTHQDLDPHSVVQSLDGSKDAISQSENHDVHKVTILNRPEEDVPLTGTQGSNVHGGCLEDKVLSERNREIVTHRFTSNELHRPILPWINGNGSMNKVVYNGLVRRVLGIVTRNPGITEENIICLVDVLNPQSCRSLLELMILDKHLIVRKMHQTTSSGPPALLGTLIGSSFRESKSVYRKHFFANPKSVSML